MDWVKIVRFVYEGTIVAGVVFIVWLYFRLLYLGLKDLDEKCSLPWDKKNKKRRITKKDVWQEKDAK